MILTANVAVVDKDVSIVIVRDKAVSFLLVELPDGMTVPVSRPDTTILPFPMAVKGRGFSWIPLQASERVLPVLPATAGRP